MRKSKSLIAAEREWIGKQVSVYTRTYENYRRGPYLGTVRAVSDSYLDSFEEGSDEFSETGLLVEIPELGHNSTYGLWPIRFSDAEPTPTKGE